MLKKNIFSLLLVMSFLVSPVITVFSENVDSEIRSSNVSQEESYSSEESETIESTLSSELDLKKIPSESEGSQVKMEQDESLENTVQDNTVQDNEFIKETFMGQEIELPKETPEMSDDNFYQEVLIDETQQHALSSSFKSSSQAIPKLNWNNKVLPRTDFIDVSSHQGTISKSQYLNLKKYGVTGVIVKLTEATTYRNPFAASQISNAKAAGLKVAVYHYSWFTNKKSAEQEADYFMSFARELGLGSDTIMINDIEQWETKGKYTTANSVYFAKRLILTHGVHRVLHYSSLSWFTDGTLNTKTLGGDKSVWVAQYLYNPDKNNLQHTTKSAWQWASDVKFPGDSRQFDVNIDYTGWLSNQVEVSWEGPYISFGKYVEISKSNYKLYSNFKWKVKANSKDKLNKVYLARGKYNHSNGSVYYSLYDVDGKWQGYLNKNAIKIAKDQGPYIPVGKYVFVKSANYNLHQNFSWKEKKNGSEIAKKTYLAKGKYHHTNGSVYYSLYDDKNNWQGYINKNAVVESEKQGKAIGTNRYVEITKENYDVWSDFNWKSRFKASKIIGKQFLVKVRYNHVNGNEYYSLYDSDGKWQGYINKKGTKSVGNQGPYIAFGKYVFVKSSNYNLHQNFSWKKKKAGSAISKKTYLAKGKYNHTNGSTYYSLYDDKNNWQGYINKNAVVETDKKGKAIGADRYVKISKPNYSVWDDFNCKLRYKASELKGKNFT